MPKPSRKVVTRSPKRTVGLINCRWFQPRPIEHESRLEKHFILRSILHPALESIQHQPFKVSLGGRASYTPDFLLTFLNGERIVVEVKRAAKVKELKERFSEIDERLKQRKYSFFVVHEVQIEHQKIAQRACLLRRYATLTVPAELADAAAALVGSSPKGIRIEQLRKATGLGASQLYALIARRLVAINSRLLLSDEDRVFPIIKEISHAAVQFGSWFGCAPWKPNA